MTTERSAREAEDFLAANPDVANIQVILTDADGVGRGKSVRRSELARIYTDGRLLPGSILGLDITGADVEEAGLLWEDGDADRVCWPIAGTLVRSPWLVPAAGQLLTSMYELDGTPSPGDPRHALKRVVDRFAELNLTPAVAIELEFYLLDRARGDGGRPQPPASPVTGFRPRQLQAYLLTDLVGQAPCLADVYAACEAQGLPAQTLISEYAPGQLEIVLHHRADALRAVDEAIMYKRLVRGVAAKHSMDATFMAKPYADKSGSGMHMHISVQDAGGRNALARDAPQGHGAAAPRHRRHGRDHGRVRRHLRAQRQLLSPIPPQFLCPAGADLGCQQPLGEPARAGGRAGDAPCRAPRRRRRCQSLSCRR